MDAKLKVLVVEDEESIRSGLCDVLVFHGYAPEAVATGEEGLRRALGEPFDLVLLDVMLPGLSGLDVCLRLREQRSGGVQILMLTAKGSENDVVAGLEAGADDYVTKPFSVRELVARVAVLARRAEARRSPEAEFTFGPWTVDSEGLRARGAGGAEIQLSAREVGLLDLFARERGRVVSRRRLLEEVWEMRNVEEIETRTVDVHIAKLRRKIDPGAAAAAGGGSMIETVRGAGYRFRPPSRSRPSAGAPGAPAP
ncbi:MAG: response regulator transcription factor [Acidobacteriota bacterium]